MEPGWEDPNKFAGKGQLEKGQKGNCARKGKPSGPKGPQRVQIVVEQQVVDTAKKEDVIVEDKQQQLARGKQVESVLQAVLKLLGGVPLPAELQKAQEGMFPSWWP